jgi:Spy/CpxP family protein refolding chaperone
MRRTRSHFLYAAALVGLAVTTSADAQRPGRPRDGAPGPQAGAMSRDPVGPQGRRRGPDGPRGNAAAMLLRLRERLALTDDQVKRLEAQAAAGAPKANASDMLRARADLMDAMQGDGNLGGARTALDRMSRLRTDRMIAGLKQRQEARAVLTADQKRTLDNMRQGARERGGRGARGLRGRRGVEGQPGLRQGAGRTPQGPRGRLGRQGGEVEG